MFDLKRKVSSYFKMANNNLQSVLNVKTQVRCKQSSVIYIFVNKELLELFSVRCKFPLHNRRHANWTTYCKFEVTSNFLKYPVAAIAVWNFLNMDDFEGDRKNNYHYNYKYKYIYIINIITLAVCAAFTMFAFLDLLSWE